MILRPCVDLLQTNEEERERRMYVRNWEMPREDKNFNVTESARSFLTSPRLIIVSINCLSDTRDGTCVPGRISV